MPEWGTFGTALQHFWDVPRAEKVAGGGGAGTSSCLAMGRAGSQGIQKPLAIYRKFE